MTENGRYVRGRGATGGATAARGGQCFLRSELHIDALFASKLCEQGVLGRTCTPAFAQHEPKLIAIRNAPVRQLPDVVCRRDEVLDARGAKQAGDRTPGCQRTIRELFQNVVQPHASFPRPDAETLYVTVSKATAAV